MRGVKLLNLLLAVCLGMVFLGILVILLPSFQHIHDIPTSPTSTTATTSPALPPEATSATSPELKVPDLSVTEDLSFACTAEDFIQYYNGLYSADKDALWLSSLADWSLYPGEEAPCTGVSCDRYTFDPDPAIHNEPAISLYLLDGRVTQVTVTLAEHDWTQWRQDMFLEQCRYTLRVFFPELPGTEIEALTARLYEEGTQARHTPASCPVYYQGSAGCCVYSRNGIIYVCVVPVSENITDGRYVPLA